MNEKEIIGKRYQRSAQILREQVDEEKRSVEVAFSSEQPVTRFFGLEVLDHDKADLSWIASGRAPVLKDHDPKVQIGVVESAEISPDRVGRAILRFGKSEVAEQEFRDIVDGIRQNVATPAPAGAPIDASSLGSFNDFSAIAGNGAVMRFGHLEKFAQGGVVSRPTSFPMSNGRMGLMGEAGEEAIMPLRRGRGGRLGVEANIGKGKPTVVNVNVIDQRTSGNNPEVREGTDQHGNKQISVLIRDEVKKGFAEGAFDKNLKVFGLNRGGVGRT